MDPRYLAVIDSQSATDPELSMFLQRLDIAYCFQQLQRHGDPLTSEEIVGLARRARTVPLEEQVFVLHLFFRSFIFPTDDDQFRYPFSEILALSEAHWQVILSEIARVEAFARLVKHDQHEIDGVSVAQLGALPLVEFEYLVTRDVSSCTSLPLKWLITVEFQLWPIIILQPELFENTFGTFNFDHLMLLTQAVNKLSEPLRKECIDALPMLHAMLPKGKSASTDTTMQKHVAALLEKITSCPPDNRRTLFHAHSRFPRYASLKKCLEKLLPEQLLSCDLPTLTALFACDDLDMLLDAVPFERLMSLPSRRVVIAHASELGSFQSILPFLGSTFEEALTLSADTSEQQFREAKTLRTLLQVIDFTYSEWGALPQTHQAILKNNSEEVRNSLSRWVAASPTSKPGLATFAAFSERELKEFVADIRLLPAYQGVGRRAMLWSTDEKVAIYPNDIISLEALFALSSYQRHTLLQQFEGISWLVRAAQITVQAIFALSPDDFQWAMANKTLIEPFLQANISFAAILALSAEERAYVQGFQQAIPTFVMMMDKAWQEKRGVLLKSEDVSDTAAFEVAVVKPPGF